MSSFHEVAQRQYFGKQKITEEQEAEFKSDLLHHHRMVFGSNKLPQGNSWEFTEHRIWKSLLDKHQDSRFEWVKSNLSAIASGIRNHKTSVVEKVSTVLKGGKVRDVAEGVYEGILSGQHIFLYGTAGVGKTTLVKLLCEALTIPWQRIDGQSDMADIHLLGAFLPVNGELRWTPGPLVIGGNIVLLIDELPRIPSSVSNILLQPMAERSMAFADLVDGGVRQVDLSPSFTVIGTGNPFHYGGMAQKNEAVFDRFGMGFDMPHPENEARLEMLNRMDSFGNEDGSQKKEDAKLAAEVDEVEHDLSLLDVRLASKLVEISDADKKRIIHISEMVSPPEYRRRVGWFSSSSTDSRILRGAGPVDGQTQESREKHVKRFLDKYDQFLATVVQEGSNPRGEEMMAEVARISALSNGRTKVEDEDIRIAAKRCLRFRLKPFPGQEEYIAEAIRIASAFFTMDSSIYAENDRSISNQTRKDLGISLDSKDMKMIGALFGGRGA